MPAAAISAANEVVSTPSTPSTAISTNTRITTPAPVSRYVASVTSTRRILIARRRADRSSRIAQLPISQMASAPVSRQPIGIRYTRITPPSCELSSGACFSGRNSTSDARTPTSRVAFRNHCSTGTPIGAGLQSIATAAAEFLHDGSDTTRIRRRRSQTVVFG